MSHQSNHLNTQLITFVCNLYTNKNFINFSYQSTSQRYQNNIYEKKTFNPSTGNKWRNIKISTLVQVILKSVISKKCFPGSVM